MRGIAIQFNADIGTSYAYLAPITLTRDGATRNYNLAFMSDWATQVGSVSAYSHEFGHNFGLNHSSGTYTSEYDSNWDVMSNSYARWDAAIQSWIPTHTIGFHKDQLNWIPATQRIRFNTNVSGNILLERSALPSTANILYAEIPILNQPGFSYTLEYRQRATAYESGVPFDGMVIHKVDHAANRARIVDIDNNNNPNDAASVWTVGETFTDAAAGISVSVLADLGQSLRVNVTPGMQLSVLGSGDGGGTVTSAGGVSYAIQCSISGVTITGTCLRFYHPAENVTLTAVPTTGNQHVGWTGACTSGAATTCSLPMGQARTVTAIFAKATTPSQLGIAVQPSANAVSGVPLVVQPIIELRDAANQPAFQAGVPVTVTKTSGNGTLSGTLVVNTNAQGRAAFTNLVLTGSAAQVLTFTAPGMASANATAINVGIASATQLAVVTQPSATAVSGAVFVVQPVIELRDVNNQPVLQSGTIVTVSRGTGTGTLGGSLSATTNAQGRATFTNLMITGTGAHTLLFTGASLASVGSSTITLSVPTATQLSYVTHPAGAVSGQAFTVQPVIELRNVSNQPVAQAGVVVTASKASGSGTLGGTMTATTNAQGRATFSNLQIVGAGVHTLVVSANGLGAASSVDFTVSVPIPTQLAVATQPAGAETGVALSIQPVVELRDAQNREAPLSGVTVAVTRGTGTGTLGGTTIATTDAQGRATFTDLRVDGIGTHSLVFSSSGLVTVTSAVFTITGPVASQLALITQPGGAVTGLPFTVAPEVELRTAAGQPIAVSGIPITVTRSSGASTISGTTTVITGVNGRAIFPDLVLTGAGVNRLTFAAAGLSAVTSNDIVVASRPQCAVTVAAGTGGTVSGASSGDCARSVTVQATAEPFYTFVNWTENGVVVSTANPFTFSIATNRTLIANFAPVNCTLTLSAASGGAALVSNGSATGICGRQVTITASPSSNFTFANWTEGATVLSDVNPYTITLLTNRSIAAAFTATQCAVTMTSAAGGSVSVTAGGTTGQCGRQVTVQATPNGGFTFANWTENGVAASSANPWTFTVASPVSVSAVFAAVPINPQQMATRFASSLLGGALDFTVSERQWLDTQGNRNDLVDLGDLVALLQKNPTVTINAALLNSVLASPRALHFTQPVKDSVKQ